MLVLFTRKIRNVQKKRIKLFLQNFNAVFSISQFNIDLNVRQCLLFPRKSPMISVAYLYKNEL